jgi:phosphatidylserine/phosphatidylglycerophosphate/cardiolipin synthase-like enzyme
MRVRKSSKGLVVRAVAGAHVVLLAFDYPKAKCKGLRGFAVHRTDHTEKREFWLRGMKTFRATDPGKPPGTMHSLREHPVQDFSWADYSAKPGHSYSYRVLALKGPPSELAPVADLTVKVKCEDPEDGLHDIYFNRGAAASQEFARRFGDRKPSKVVDDGDPAWAWLSRGAHEAILDFIARAKGASFGLRVGAYEFRLPTVSKALKDAKQRGADVKVVYDGGKGGKGFPGTDNRAEAKRAGIKSLCTERTPKPQAISHNKFIVLLKNQKAIAVLTGSTNFSTGGVFGQSNVVHVVEEPKVAEAYLAYWDRLRANPARKDLAPALTADLALWPQKPPKGTTAVFSPRSEQDALDFYGRLALGAKDGLFATFAFGMNDVFVTAYRDGKAMLRYALMEKLLGPGVKKADKPKALAGMQALRNLVENRFAVGGRLNLNEYDRWLSEELTGLNTHVKYIHTKYMVVDPLGADPIVVTGSANFSKASSISNDENMLVIRGDKRVADIYLVEFMRLWEHNAYREWASSPRGKKQRKKAWHLDDTDKWWKRHFGETDYSHDRRYMTRSG